MEKCKEIVDARSKSNPAIRHLIANCQLPVADLIFNWQLTIGNWQLHRHCASLKRNDP
jgi:hypothetical protein